LEGQFKEIDHRVFAVGILIRRFTSEAGESC
jgi:hypothetical protein